MHSEAKEEVRARLSIEDVIGEYVQLKRAGRNFKGLSPFTSEKTPSFVVSPDKQIWHDFSSGRGGDVFSFVMEVEGTDFRGALEQLARRAGVDLDQYKSSGSRHFAEKKRRLLEMNQLAGKFFQATLVRNRPAIEYVFKQRGLTKATVGEFGIGYAADAGSALVDFLKKRGYRESELRQSGLTNRFGGDLFRGRMIVPLMDASGATIGFTGRIIMDAENAPKYLNTPSTLLYDKSRHVFGLSQAKQAIRENDYVVIVEGNLDVVSSHQADVRNVVATAGTAMTEHHLTALKRLTSDIRLCYDGDRAGIAATKRTIELASKLGVELSIIELPEEFKDPDELISHDVAAWRRATTITTPAVEWVIEHLARQHDLQSARGKRQLTTEALAVIALLDDAVESEHYLEHLSKKTGTTLASLGRKLETASSDQSPRRLRPIAADLSQSEPLDSRYNYQDDLLSLALITPNALELFAEFDATLLEGDERQTLARYFAAHHQIFDDVPPELHDIATYVKIAQVKADTRYSTWSDDDRYYEIAQLIRRVQQEHIKKTKTDLTARLRDAEAEGDEARALELRNQLHSIIKELARAKRRH